MIRSQQVYAEMAARRVSEYYIHNGVIYIPNPHYGETYVEIHRELRNIELEGERLRRHILDRNALLKQRQSQKINWKREGF